jgi:hypothetical protein
MNTYSERGKLIKQVRDAVESKRGQNLFDPSGSGDRKGKARRTAWLLDDLHFDGILGRSLALDIKNKIGVDFSKAGRYSIGTMEDLYAYCLKKKFGLSGEFHRKTEGR